MRKIERIMLTGASGYIGRNVLQALLERTDCQIVAVTRDGRRPATAARLNWLEGDLLDEKDCRRLVADAGAECLIHLAWYAEHGRFWDAPENLHWTRATLNLLEGFKERGGKRAVFAGSCAEYDWSHGYCVEGKTPTEPDSLYGQCKDATRRLVAAYCRVSGVEYAWGRLFYPYGLGEPPGRLVPSVIAALLGNRPVRCSHGAQFRDFLHVRDAAAAFAHLAADTAATGDFNISSGSPVRIRDLVTLCVRLARPGATPQFGALPAPDNDPPMLVGDNRRLTGTGWQPEIALEEGLRMLIDETSASPGP